MWTLFLVAGLLSAQTPQQTPQTSGAVAPLVQPPLEVQARLLAGRGDPLELTLAAPVQLPNGRRLGASVRPAVSTEPWFVYTRGNLCQSGITHSAPPADVTEGWKVTVVERSRAGSQVTLGVTWSRMWERGRQVASGSGGTSELVLQRGDRLSLDTITRASDPAVCAGTSKSLELQVGATTITSPAPAGDSPLDGIVDAELWMVHTLPNGTEIVEHQIVRLVNGVIGFAFRGGPVDTAGGQVAIELSGQLKAVKREDGSRGLWAALTRGVTRLATGLTSISGPTTTTAEWLTPKDVVSLDLPPLYYSGGRSLAGGGGGRGGGGVGVPRGTGSGTVTAGAQSGGGAGGLVRGGAGGSVISSGGRGTGTTPPNLLEGHKLSLRVKLAESPR